MFSSKIIYPCFALLFAQTAAPLVAQCPKTPADMFDLKKIHSMTLKDFGWKQISRRTLPGGVVFLEGKWNGGPFSTYDSRGRPRTINLTEHAGLLIPKGPTRSAGRATPHP